MKYHLAIKGSGWWTPACLEIRELGDKEFIFNTYRAKDVTCKKCKETPEFHLALLAETEL